MLRSPWRMTTLPDTTTLPSTSAVKLLSSLSMVTGSLDGSVRGATTGGAAAGSAGLGQTVSSACAWDANNSVKARPQVADFLEVNGTVLRTILIRMLKNDSRLALIRT